MRFEPILVLGFLLIFGGCATAKAPETVWSNAVDPSRNFDRDSQECELIANALMPSSGNPILRLAIYRGEWNRCMGGRNWREVELAQASDSVRTPSVVDARWRQFAQTAELTSYIDTTRIERRTDGTVALWVNEVYSRNQETAGIQYRRLVTHREYDCTRKRTRQTAVAAYDEGQKLITSGQIPADWIEPLPESRDEAMLRILCAPATRSR